MTTRRPSRTPPAKVSRVAVLAVSITAMLGMIGGMSWSAAVSAAEAAPAGVIAASSSSGVLGETRSRVGAVAPPAAAGPSRHRLSITRSGGSR